MDYIFKNTFPEEYLEGIETYSQQAIYKPRFVLFVFNVWAIKPKALGMLGKHAALKPHPQFSRDTHKNVPQAFQASWDILDWDFCISMCASPSFDCFISTSSTLWIKLFYFKYRENCSYIDFYHTTCRMFYTFPFLFRLISFPNRPFHLGQVKWVFLIPLFLWSTSLMRPSIVPTSNTKHCISVYNVATSCGWLQIVIRQVYFILVALGFC